MPNCYLTIFDYLRAVTGQETASLIGNLFHLSGSGVIAGATSLPVTPITTVQLNQYDMVTIFDGSSTEIVTVSASTAPGASSIPVSATQFAHVAGTSGCSDGRLGSLAEAIIEGCAEVERVCRQPLLQATYTLEALPLLTMRALITNTGTLMIRPRQSPVTAVSAIQLSPATSAVLNLDVTQVQLDAIGKIVKVPTIQMVGNSIGNAYPLINYADPTMDGNCLISYTAGFAYAQLPPIIKRSAVLLISDILSDRLNPSGAAENQEGKVHYATYLRGDLSGETANVKRARRWLNQYMQDAW